MHHTAFDRVFERSSRANVLVDNKTGIIIRVNPTAQALGFSEGRPVGDYYPPTFTDADFKDLMKRAEEQGASGQSVGEIYLHPEGRTATVCFEMILLEGGVRFTSMWLCEAPAALSQLPDLSQSELEVARRVRNGQSTKVIADRLHISPRTVDNHRRSIRRKLGLNPKENLELALRGYDFRGYL